MFYNKKNIKFNRYAHSAGSNWRLGGLEAWRSGGWQGQRQEKGRGARGRFLDCLGPIWGPFGVQFGSQNPENSLKKRPQNHQKQIKKNTELMPRVRQNGAEIYACQNRKTVVQEQHIAETYARIGKCGPGTASKQT